MAGYLYNLCNSNSVQPLQEVEFQTVTRILPDYKRRQQITALLHSLFTERVVSMETTPLENALQVKIVHTTRDIELPSLHTSLHIPAEVHFTLDPNGSLTFNESNYAPYEQNSWNFLKSYYSWHRMDIIGDTFHVGSTVSLGIRATLVSPTESPVREVPMASFLDIKKVAQHVIDTHTRDTLQRLFHALFSSTLIELRTVPKNGRLRVILHFKEAYRMKVENIDLHIPHQVIFDVLNDGLVHFPLELYAPFQSHDRGSHCWSQMRVDNNLLRFQKSGNENFDFSTPLEKVIHSDLLIAALK